MKKPAIIPPTASRGCGLLGLERDYTAETFQSASEVGRGAVWSIWSRYASPSSRYPRPLESMWYAETRILWAMAGRTKSASAGLQAVILVLEIAPFRLAGGDRCSNENGAKMEVALAGKSAPLLAGALVVARTQAAKRFFRRLLKGLQYAPRAIVTDKLRSYDAARRHLAPQCRAPAKPITIALRTHTDRPDEENDRCSASNLQSKPRRFSPLMHERSAVAC
jgi:hypothetical protein